jgi:hypothetical protein
VRLLLDECVDRRLARVISGHEVLTVPERGWAGVKNGALLALAAGEFDVFITIDRQLPLQQDLSRFAIAVVVMRARSTRLSELQALVPQLLAILPAAKKGEVTWIGV